MVEYSSKHYSLESADSAERSKNEAFISKLEAEKAKGYADSINPSLFANTSLDNATPEALYNIANLADAQGKELITGWGMPDYTAGVSISSGYVASRNSAIAGYMMGGSGYATLKVNGVNVIFSIGGGIVQDPCPAFILVSKGDIITWTLTTGSANISLSSYPLKGVL